MGEARENLHECCVDHLKEVRITSNLAKTKVVHVES